MKKKEMEENLKELGRINALFPSLHSKDIAKIADLLKQREEEVLRKVEKVLFTENGFLREDENLASDILESLKENT